MSEDLSTTSRISDSSISDTQPVMIRVMYGRRWIAGDLLGSGKFGRVYAATDRRGIHSDVVVKVPTTDARSADIRYEGRVLGVLNDFEIPHVPHFLDYTGQALVMTRIRGFSLESVSHKPAETPESIRIRASYLIRPAYTLEAAVAHDLVHCDIKPAHIIVSEGTGHLIDWGLARNFSSETEPQRIGAWDTMAPELLGFETAPNPATEIWSLAATLYTTLLSRPPRGFISQEFQDPDRIAGVLHSAPIRNPQRINRDFPPRLTRLIMDSLSKYPTFRPEPQEFRAELEKCVESLS